MAGVVMPKWMLTEEEIDGSYTPVNHIYATHRLSIDQIQEIILAGNRRLVEWISKNLLRESDGGTHLSISKDEWQQLRRDVRC
ncbi:MAG: hypothetical protein HY677_01825 [Chloroflexi bacterium]|nr:hypothetical protein [Chloroflexota bacterium]